MPGQRIEHRGVSDSLGGNITGPNRGAGSCSGPRGLPAGAADGAVGFSGAVVAKHREQRPHSNKLSVTLPPRVDVNADAFAWRCRATYKRVYQRPIWQRL